MTTVEHPTVIAAVAAIAKTRPTQPLITFYDDNTGERVELSATSLINWVAKTANLLVEATMLDAGDLAAVRLPAHWQTAAVLLGCWSAGLTVDLDGSSRPTPPVVFASGDRLDEADAAHATRFALALAPLAAPFRPGPPAGALDYVVEVRGQGDHFAPVTPVTPTTIALADGTTHRELAARARAHPLLADGTRPAPGARLLIDGDATDDPVRWLVAPLLAEASIVLCRGLDRSRLAQRLAAEHAVATTGVTS